MKKNCDFLSDLLTQQAEQFGLTGTPLFPVSAAGPSGEATAGESSQTVKQEKKEEEEVGKESTAESQGTAESQEDE